MDYNNTTIYTKSVFIFNNSYLGFSKIIHFIHLLNKIVLN